MSSDGSTDSECMIGGRFVELVAKYKAILKTGVASKLSKRAARKPLIGKNKKIGENTEEMLSARILHRRNLSQSEEVLLTIRKEEEFLSSPVDDANAAAGEYIFETIGRSLDFFSIEELEDSYSSSEFFLGLLSPGNRPRFGHDTDDDGGSLSPTFSSLLSLRSDPLSGFDTVEDEGSLGPDLLESVFSPSWEARYGPDDDYYRSLPSSPNYEHGSSADEKFQRCFFTPGHDLSIEELERAVLAAEKKTLRAIKAVAIAKEKLMLYKLQKRKFRGSFNVM